MHVGELVLDRLVGADHPAELAALLGVFDRRVEQRLARTDQLRGGGQRTELVGARDVGGLRITGSGDVEQLSAGVDGFVLLTRGAVTDLAVAGDQDQTRRVGVDCPRHLRRQRDGGDQLTGRQRRAAVVVGKQNRCHRNGFGDRPGHTPAAQPLGGDHEIDGVRLDAVELLRHGQRGDAEVGQLCPHLAAGGGVARGPGPHRGGQIGGGQRRVDAGGEVALLFVQIELHFAFSRGRPSSRSAMMLR